MNEKYKIALQVAEGADPETAARITEQFQNDASAELILRLDGTGLALVCDDQVLQGDFTRMLPRLKYHNLTGELLVRAAKIKDADHPLTAVDATAGLGEDSLLLAASGFHVKLFEKNPVIYELLRDALRRASQIPELSEIVSRMEVRNADSIEAMADLGFTPDVILLDPMFPERRKSALVKNKLQMIQKLEFPCVDEAEMLRTAMTAAPHKLIVKRPPKGPFLAGLKPDHSLAGKAVRFDCFVSPADRLHKFKF